jgi:hypothetical protein
MQQLPKQASISMGALATGESFEQDVAWMMAFQAGDGASFGRIVDEYRAP